MNQATTRPGGQTAPTDRPGQRTHHLVLLAEEIHDPAEALTLADAVVAELRRAKSQHPFDIQRI